MVKTSGCGYLPVLHYWTMWCNIWTRHTLLPALRRPLIQWCKTLFDCGKWYLSICSTISLVLCNDKQVGSDLEMNWYVCWWTGKTYYCSLNKNILWAFGIILNTCNTARKFTLLNMDQPQTHMCNIILDGKNCLLYMLR